MYVQLIFRKKRQKSLAIIDNVSFFFLLRDNIISCLPMRIIHDNYCIVILRGVIDVSCGEMY